MTVKITSPFYTYVLIRPNGIPFYVGKGTRGLRTRYTTCGNRYSQAIAAKIRSSGEKIGLAIIPAETEDAAFIEEIRLIKLYGRLDLKTGTLCNFSDGGEGAAGRKVSKETKAKLVLFATGRKPSLETRKKISCSLTGLKHSLESRQKMSKNLKENYVRRGKVKQTEKRKRINIRKFSLSRSELHVNNLTIQNLVKQKANLKTRPNLSKHSKNRPKISVFEIDSFDWDSIPGPDGLKVTLKEKILHRLRRNE